MNTLKLVGRDPPRDGRALLPPATDAACHEDRDIFRYLFKDMGSDEREAFEAHCATCVECRTRLEGTRRGIKVFFEEDERGD